MFCKCFISYITMVLFKVRPDPTTYKRFSSNIAVAAAAAAAAFPPPLPLHPPTTSALSSFVYSANIQGCFRLGQVPRAYERFLQQGPSTI